jgi:hypothetical protein
MNENVNIQNFGPSVTSIKPLVIWLSTVVLSCVWAVLIAQPSMY